MPLRYAIVTTLILALGAPLAAQADRGQAEAALAEFRTYWKNKNEFVRKAAIEELWAVDHLFVTRQLLACLTIAQFHAASSVAVACALPKTISPSLTCVSSARRAKRSMRERPQLNLLGGVSAAPVQEDWQGGHRRGHLVGDH